MTLFEILDQMLNEWEEGPEEVDAFIQKYEGKIWEWYTA